MTSPNAADLNPSVPEQLVRLLGTLPVLATICYGIGWVFFVAFFGAVGAAPEKVGASSGFVTVRAALLLLGILCVGSLLAYAIDLVDAIARARDDDRPARLLLICYSLTLLVFAILAVDGSYLIRRLIPNILLRMLVAVTAAALLAMCQLSLLLRTLGIKLIGEIISEGISVPHFVAALMIWGLSGGVMAAAFGSYLGQEVWQGHEVDIPGLSVQRVCVVPISPEARTCGLHLGGGDGFIVLYQPRPQNRLIEIPISRIDRIEGPG